MVAELMWGRWKQPPKPTRIVRSHVRADSRSYAIDRILFLRLWRLCRPYWTRRDAWWSWAILATVFVFTIGFSYSGAQMSTIVASQTNALVAKQSDLYWSIFAAYIGLSLVRFFAGVFQGYISERLNLHWRQWLTLYLVDRYLEHRTYYEITVDQEIDNPDQRIQEEVGPFVQAMANLPQRLLGASFDILVQMTILMAISRSMLVATFLYAMMQTVVTLYLYKPTIKQNWDSTVAEADLRYGLLHVRDHAEMIAFYGGEAVERTHVEARTRLAVLRQVTILKYQQFMKAVHMFSGIVWDLLPMLLIAPLYFAGQVEYGAITQGIVAGGLILQSLNTLMNYIPTLSNIVPKAVRLAEIQEKFDRLGHARASTSEISRIAFVTSDQVQLTGVSIDTPGGERRLITDLSLTVAPGDNLIIVGQTGSGKSSLLRAMAGLWTRGAGTIAMPPGNHTLFLPQQPYMMLGTLREQILYPHSTGEIDDAALQAVLERVGLPELAEQHDGFNTERDWSKVLSLGEQQRIGFARVLTAKPRFVLLDEATSAVDLPMERQLYGLLRRSGATFISVGHRESLLQFHRQMLTVSPEGSVTTPVPTPSGEGTQNGSFENV